MNPESRIPTDEFFSWQVASSAFAAAEDPRPPAFGAIGMEEVVGQRYRVEGQLGRGGMGVVLSAWDERLGRRVAIKLSTQALTDARLARFLREGELSAALDHPSIVKVHGGGVTPKGLPFLVFEQVTDARPLDEVIEASPGEALRLIEEVARAAGFAHRAGIVHRDLKFSNVLVDSAGRARVCDFGLGLREGEERLTQTGALLGTPLFMPPEQAGLLEGVSPGPPADVWALGVMLYVHLAGTFPHPASDVVSWLASLSTRDPFPIPAKDVSPALEAVCRRALHFQPARRFPDGEAFADALASAQRAPRLRRARGLAALAGPVLAGVALAVIAAGFPSPDRPAPAVSTASVLLELERGLSDARLEGPLPEAEARAARAVLPRAGDERSGLEDALSCFAAIAAVRSGDAVGASRLLAGSGAGLQRSLTEAYIARQTDPAHALRLIEGLGREPRASEEARAQSALAAMAAGEFERAAAWIRALEEAPLRERLGARLALARARQEAKALEARPALAYLERALQLDPSGTREAASAVAEAAHQGWRAQPTRLVGALALLDGIADLAGAGALPTSCGDVYLAGFRAENFVRQRQLSERGRRHAQRMSTLSPTQLRPEEALMLHQLVKDAHEAKHWRVCAELLEILVRCDDPYLFKAHGFATDPVLAELGRRIEASPNDWAPRFLRGLFRTLHLHTFTLYHRQALDPAQGRRSLDDLSALSDLQMTPRAEALTQLWLPIARALSQDPPSVQVLERGLAPLLERGIPDEYCARLILVGELRREGHAARVLEELPAARRALEARLAHGRESIPAGGTFPCRDLREAHLDQAESWARSVLAASGAGAR